MRLKKIYGVYGYYKKLGEGRAKWLGLFSTRREAESFAKKMRDDGYVASAQLYK